MLTVYVIVVTYNAVKWLDKCLGTLKTSTVPVVPVVVDNNSNDRTVDKITNCFPEVILLKNKKNLGFGKANNLGIEYALQNQADYVFLLNQDAWVYPDTIEKLILIHQQHPDYLVLSPLHLEGSASQLDYLFAHWISVHFPPGIGSGKEIARLLPNEVYPVDFVNAALWLLPRKTFETIGAFDDLFFHYGEDMDYTNRVRFHGYNIGFCPSVIGVHDRLQQSGKEGQGMLLQRKLRKSASYFVLLKNVNHSFVHTLQIFGKRMLKSFWHSIKKGDLREVASIIKTTMVVVINLRKLIRHRKLSRKMQYAFLNQVR